MDLREYKQCAEVLFDLGLCQVRVISNNPLKLGALEDSGLKIVERVSIQVEQPEEAGAYLRTKKERLGHLLEFKTQSRCLRRGSQYLNLPPKLSIRPLLTIWFADSSVGEKGRKVSSFG